MFETILAGGKHFTLKNNIEVEKFISTKNIMEEKFFQMTGEKIKLEGDWMFTASGRSIYRIHVYRLRQ